MAAENFLLNLGAVTLKVDSRCGAVGSRGTLACIVKRQLEIYNLHINNFQLIDWIGIFRTDKEFL